LGKLYHCHLANWQIRDGRTEMFRPGAIPTVCYRILGCTHPHTMHDCSVTNGINPWRAECGEYGSEGGLEKLNDRNFGRAYDEDPYAYIREAGGSADYGLSRIGGGATLCFAFLKHCGLSL
jgi:hypothetical protein